MTELMESSVPTEFPYLQGSRATYLRPLGRRLVKRLPIDRPAVADAPRRARGGVWHKGMPVNAFGGGPSSFVIRGCGTR